MISRLKSLELHGYKTFASRTVFEFPDEITAIVGPNGSGKSNIADALRWVLGEQSYSLLRGRKTEDMIFAGSDQRPRAGMAASTITFDNSDGWLPIDFSEVSIMRRAYRDGQNEYLLNGQRVRLKEISELLAQSGLAERTYTIIGQGLVDAALSLKPEERRRFFEEAAGIGLYRSRREEAINRLDATQRNLERVRDILGELEPRLQSLEKQARRVQEYERIKADLRMLLREWYGYHFHHAQKDLAHSREVSHTQETRLEQARLQLQVVEEEVAQARSRLQSLRNELNDWHAQLSGLHHQSEQVNRTLAVMDERQRALGEQKVNLLNDLARVEEEQKAAQDRLKALSEERDWLQNELTDSQAQAEKAHQYFQSRQQQRQMAERKVSDWRRQLLSAETQQVQSRAHYTELVSRLETQRKSQQTLAQAVEQGDTVLQQAQAGLAQVKNQRLQAENEVKQVEQDIQEIRRAVFELEAGRKRAQEKVAQFSMEKARLHTQMDVLEQAEKSFSGLNQGARFLLQEARQGKIGGKFSAISSLIEVPADYELAIAAVLGDYLDGILVDDQAGLENALVLLGKGEKGRAVLIPSQATRPGEKVVIEDPDCVGVAVDLVSYSADLQQLVRLLLGQVLVVKNRGAARRIASQIPITARAVTLQGEVFWGSGVVIAGQDGRAGMIGRPRQKRELQEALAQTNNKLQEMTGELQRFEASQADQQKLLQETEKNSRFANQRLAQANQLFHQASLEVDRLNQKQDWQRSQFTGLEAQLQRTDGEIKQVIDDLEKKDQQIKQFNEGLLQQAHELNTLPLEELQAEVIHWNTSLAVSERAVKEADRRLAEHQQALTGLQLQRASLGQRLANVLAVLEQIEKERSDYRSQEELLDKDIGILQQKVEPAENDLETAEKDYSRWQENQTVAQQAVTVAERYATQAQLEVTRNREALDSLRRRIEDDFGLVVYEYDMDIAGPNPLPLEGMTEQLPVVKEISPEIEDSINRQRALLRRLGAINPEAQTEYQAVHERYDFLTVQVADLKQADGDLRLVITELDELMRKEFRRTFDAVAAEFRQMFTRLFGGGSAHLSLTDEDDPTETGIDIETRLPGRREQGLSLLSGGERSLTAVALIFALLKVSPTPFCVLDEVDAMLDESNVGRFCDLLNELSQKTQFIVITHNRNTVQNAGVIYGVTMGRDSTSQVISLKLDEVNDELVR
ncbi:MAG: chromosome segregation protein SMC [Anaerolineaceae bacterium]|jgi:chromosome segregation protein